MGLFIYQPVGAAQTSMDEPVEHDEIASLDIGEARILADSFEAFVLDAI